MTKALLLIDIQNGFCPGGNLPVAQGDQIVPVANALMASGRYDLVVASQDWHPANHGSFASQHPGKAPFDIGELSGKPQMMWPDHCVQGSQDAAVHKDIDLPNAQLVIRKGFHKDTDSYSAFMEADRKTSTGLAAYLTARGITEVYVAGLATDFCVAWTALDARKAGFKAAVIEDASRGIDLNGSVAKAWADMTKAGVRRIKSTDLA